MRINLTKQSPALLAKMLELACRELVNLCDPDADCTEKDWRDELFVLASMELEREADYHPQPTVADLAANPQTREDVEAAATAPPRIDPVREPMITSRTALKHHVAPLRFGGYLVGTGRAVLDELERELTEASRAEILEWCVGQLDGEPLDDDAHYRFEIDKLGSDLVMRTVMYLRRYCTLRPEGRE